MRRKELSERSEESSACRIIALDRDVLFGVDQSRTKRGEDRIRSVDRFRGGAKPNGAGSVVADAAAP